MSIGDRIREVRKRRGLTQRELAKASGMSIGGLRKLEQGERDTRIETLRKIAQALKVPTTALSTEGVSVGADHQTVDRWAPVRAALDTPHSGALPIEDEPTYQGVLETLGATRPLFEGDRFAELAAVLPALIRDTDLLAETGTPEARQLRVRLLHLVGWLMVQTRQFTAAADALDRAFAEAPDRLHAAAIVNTRCWLHLRCGRLGEAANLAATWADRIEPRLSQATMSELSAWGWLLLRVSAAAIRDNRPAEAADSLRLAESAAVAMGREYSPREDFLRTFGPVTVLLKRAENASVADRPDLVLDLAARVPRDGLQPTSNNANRHLLDVARAHMRLRQHTEAVSVLERVRRRSPQWLPNQVLARDIVTDLVHRRRNLTDEMRILADAVHLPM